MNLIFFLSLIFYNFVFSGENEKVYTNLILCCLKGVSNKEHFKRKLSNQGCCYLEKFFYEKFYSKNDIIKLQNFYKKYLFNINRSMFLYEKALDKEYYKFKVYMGSGQISEITLDNKEIKERFFLCGEILLKEAKKLMDLSELYNLENYLKKLVEFSYLNNEIQKIKIEKYFFWRINEIFEKKTYKSNEGEKNFNDFNFDDFLSKINDNQEIFVKSLNEFYYSPINTEDNEEIKKIAEEKIDLFLYFKYRFGLEQIGLNA